MKGVKSAEAVIDNGEFGVRKIRFETGRLARQASGSALVVLDDETVVLSATSASKQPREGLDFFPLTVDVEERMYAIGRIPGSFFRREGRPSEDAILTCRLIDRPLRPSFVKGLRNEIQIVETILALHPEHLYDVVAINAASMSTQLAGLPFAGPIGGVRVALIKDQWVAFPTHPQLEQATFDMVVAGRVLDDGDVAIMMVEAESTPQTLKLLADAENTGAVAPDEETVAEGLEAAKPFIAALCEAQRILAAAAVEAGLAPATTSQFPIFVDYGEDVFEAVAGAVSDELAKALTIAGKQERARRGGPGQGPRARAAGGEVRGPREGDQRRHPVADQEAGPPAGGQRRAAHRRARAHRHPAALGRGRRAAPGARLGAVRAGRDPDPGRHHAEHAPHGADDRHAQPRAHQALHAQLQLPAVLDR